MKTQFTLLILFLMSMPLQGDPLHVASGDGHDGGLRPRTEGLDLALRAASLQTEGMGIGQSVSAAAGIGVGAFGELVRFGDKVIYYCGPQVAYTSDVQAAARAYQLKSFGCDSNKYSGGFLNLDLSATLPGIELGGGATLSLGVNGHFPKFMGQMIRRIENTNQDMLSYARQAGEELFASAAEKGGALGLGSTISWSFIQSLLGSQLGSVPRDTSFAGKFKVGMGALKKSGMGEAELKLMFEKVLKYLKETISKMDDSKPLAKKALLLWVDTLSDLYSAMNFCISVATGSSAGVGMIPITGSLSYSYYVQMAEYSPDSVPNAPLTTLKAAMDTTSGKCVTEALRNNCAIFSELQNTRTGRYLIAKAQQTVSHGISLVGQSVTGMRSIAGKAPQVWSPSSPFSPQLGTETLLYTAFPLLGVMGAMCRNK